MKYGKKKLYALIFAVLMVAIFCIHFQWDMSEKEIAQFESVTQPTNACGINGAYYTSEPSDSLVFEDGILVGVR